MAVLALTLKGDIKEVMEKLKNMTDAEFNRLKTSALSTAANKVKEVD